MLTNFVEYIQDLFNVFFRPIYFYTFMDKGSIKDKPLKFLIISSWIFALSFSFFIFILLILPTFYGLIQNIPHYKLSIIIPLFIFFVTIFFVIIALALGPFVILFTLAITIIFAIILDFLVKSISRNSNIKSMLKACFYNSSVLIIYSFIVFLSLFSVNKSIPVQYFHSGISFIIILSFIFLWGLWSISVRKIYGLSKEKSIGISFIVFILVVLFYLGIGQKFLMILARRLL